MRSETGRVKMSAALRSILSRHGNGEQRRQAAEMESSQLRFFGGMAGDVYPWPCRAETESDLRRYFGGEPARIVNSSVNSGGESAPETPENSGNTEGGRRRPSV